jgi:zinc protease
MQAVRAQSERGWLQALAHQDQRADLISHHTLLHDDPHAVNTHLEEVLAVTPEQIQAATTTLLRPEQRAVVAYLRAPHGAEEES